ncbi:sensor histidine kinase [Kocuria sp.]|uniref:sensor histidine kinase n=1 Tax=Kocuria sp. TaxID=1871328 RepID=UPI0026DF9B36|nr:ATP-binding protein [Kocuria sp.]MDO5619474.1 ATP-binding protein [Kocuria sp.]
MSLARRFLLIQLVLVLGITVAVAVVLIERSSADVRREAASVTRAMTLSLAEDPWVAEQAESPDPTATLQPHTLELVRDTDIDFVTIMSPDGIRWTHSNPDFVGQPYSGSISEALDGEVHTATEMGRLGMSMRTIAPVYNDDGRVVALVSTGVLLDNISAEAWAQIPVLIALAIALFLVSSAVTGGLTRYLSRVTGGRGPEALAEAVAVQDAVLEQAAQGLLMVEGGRLLLINPRAQSLLGIQDQDLAAQVPAGRPWRRRVRDHVLDRRRSAAPQLTDVPLPDELVEVLVREQTVREKWMQVGENTLIVTTTRASKPSRGMVAVIRDHTELTRLSGQLQATTLMADALRSQTHEHANRMHTVVSLLELGCAEQALDFASEDLRRSRSLSGDVESAVTDPILAALLMGKTAAAAERGVRLEVSVDGTAPPLPLSPAETVTVVGNLIDNAVDAVTAARDSAGGDRTVSHPLVEVELARGDTNGIPVALLTVADNGPGVADDQVEQIFRRGVSTKPTAPNTSRGVGLDLVRRTVEHHGGTVRVFHDDGAVFEISLPLERTGSQTKGQEES